MTFSDRLRRAKERAGLTVDELALWLGEIHRQTVWNWLQGREPQDYRMPQLERWLGALERELKRQKSELPPPLSVRQGEQRRAYVRAIRSRYHYVS